MRTSLFSRLASLAGWRAHLAAAALGLLSALALPPLHVLPVLLLVVPGLLVLIGAAPGWRGAVLRGFWFGFAHHLVGLYWITDAILVEAARYWWLVPLAVPGGFGDVFIQPAAWVGVPGLTLFTLLLAATPALGRRALGLGMAGLVAWAGFGIVRLSAPPPAAPGVEVVLAQGNVAQGEKWNRARAFEIFRRYLALTREGLAKARAEAPTATAVVVWPESASPFLADDPGAVAAIAEAAGGAPALIGSVRFGHDERPRNSLVALVGGGPAVAVYDKWHLVPFGEYSPGWVPLAVQLAQGGGFAPGPGPQTLHVPGLPPFGPLICYEAIFPAQVVDEADRPAWMVNVTNDAWFGNSTGPRQHLAAARLRAVEEGLPLVRAANTGISAAFDAYGREQARLGLGVAGTVVVALPGAVAPPLFARFGLVIPGILAGITLLTGIVRRGFHKSSLPGAQNLILSSSKENWVDTHRLCC